MRLKESQVQRIVRKILDTLQQQQLITYKAPEGRVYEAMCTIFVDNLKAEKQIEAEAQKLLEAHLSKGPASVDQQKLFHMIKKELAKKHRVII